jgi:hypothetical protein
VALSLKSGKEGHLMANLYTPRAIWGRELRHYRKGAGLTQGRLSQKVHFSESLISGVETGQLPASPESAQTCDMDRFTDDSPMDLWRKRPVGNSAAEADAGPNQAG